MIRIRSQSRWLALGVLALGSMARASTPVRQSTPPTLPAFAERIEARLGPVVAAHEDAGVSVVLVRGADVVHASSVGASAVDELYPIGSVSGALTATVCVELHELGLLLLDEPIARLLGLEGEAAEALAKVTPRHLLRHTAGLPFDVAGALDTDADIVAALLASEPLRPPGSEYRYSRVGYALLGKLMRRATTRSYRDLLVGYLTSQLGMEATRIVESTTELVYAPADGIHAPPLELARFVSLQLLPAWTGEPVPSYVVREVQRPQPVEGDPQERSFAWRLESTDAVGTFLTRSDESGEHSTLMAFAPTYKMGLVLTGQNVGDLQALGTSLLGDALEFSATRATLELLERSELVAALPGLQQFCREYPEDGFGWYWYGVAKLSESVPEKALVPLGRAWDLGFRPAATGYELARANALLGKADEAFRWLDEAVRNGFRAGDALAADEAFDPLRADPRFDALENR